MLETDAVEPWLIQLFGVPSAIRNGKAARLRTNKTWCVLACLLLEPRPHRRETLAARFWDQGDNRQSLRKALSSLRENFGADAFLENGKITIEADRERFLTDVELVWKAREEARMLENAHQRLLLLSEAADRVRGEFLEGFDDLDEEQEWMLRQRERLRPLVTDIFLELARTLVETHNPRAAFEVICRAATLCPQSDAVKTQVLKLGRLTDQHELAVQITREMNFESVSERLAELESVRTPLMLSEQKAFEAVFIERIEDLPLSQYDTLSSLAVFPASFTAAQAKEIGDITPVMLRTLVEKHLVLREGERFGLLNIARSLLWDRLSLARQQEMQKRHAHFFMQWWEETALRWKSSPGSYPERDDAQIRQESAHLLQTLQWLCGEEPTYRALEFVEHLHIFGLTDMALPALPWCEQAARSTTLPLPIQYKAVCCLIRIKEEQSEFLSCRDWIEIALAMPFSGRTPEGDAYQHLRAATNSHHGEDFERAILWAQRALALFQEHGNLDGQAAALRQLGETRRTIGDLTAALADCESALELYRRLENRWLNVAEALHQVGVVRRRLGDLDGALRCWGEALEIRQATDDPHGLADCLQGIGTIRAEQGFFAEARAHIENALRLYTEANKPASHAACRVRWAICCGSRDACLKPAHCMKKDLPTGRRIRISSGSSSSRIG